MRLFSPTTHSLIAIYRETKRLWNAHASELGLTPNQLRVLFRVWEAGRCPMSTLVEHLSVTTGAVTGMADKLEKEGLLIRVPSSTDRRVWYLEVPESAVQRVETIWTEWDKRLSAWITRVPETERLNLESGLAALAAATRSGEGG